MNMDIRLVDARDPAVVSLIQEADEYASSLYPPESNHLESIAALEKSNVAFFGAYVLTAGRVGSCTIAIGRMAAV